MNAADEINALKEYRDFYKKVSDLLNSGADGDYLHDELWEIHDNFDVPDTELA